MTNAESTGGLPTVGIECRSDGTGHGWERINAGREEDPEMRARGARYFRQWRCRNNCGAEKIKRLDRMGCFITELTRITYTDKGYLLKGGVDETQMGLLRLQELDPDAPPLKQAAKKTPAKKTATKKTPAKKVTAERIAEPEPMKRASQRKPAASTSARKRTAAKQPTTRRTKQSA